MSRIVLSFAAFLVRVPLAAQPNPSRPKIYFIAFVRLKASDFEKSNAFYAKVLGLKLGSDDSKGISAPCFAINAYQHVELTQAGSRDAGSFLEVVGFNASDVTQMREFLAAKGIASSDIAPTADHQELGVQNHFSLGVTSANAAASKLGENGVTKFDGPEVGRDGKNALDIYDPDLSRVEVMDFTPTKKPCCHPYTAAHPKP